MSGSLTKQLLYALILVILALPAFAQNVAEQQPPVPTSTRAASFLTEGQAPVIVSPAFSGLASPPSQEQPLEPPPPAAVIVPPPTPITPPPLQAAPPVPTAVPAPLQPMAVVPVDLPAPPVVVAPLPAVSAETVGTPASQDGLGSGMWKGTSHGTAEHLLSLIAPTNSPVLNNLVKGLLNTAAVPPEGASDASQSLTSLRVEKLLALGDAPDAWSLAKNADAKLIDDITFHAAVESLLAFNEQDPCPQMSEYAKAHSVPDWQEDLIICLLKAKDNQGAQVALDVLRTQAGHNNVFIELADKNVVTTSKSLPFQLTPLTPTTIALLRLTNMPLPGDLFTHVDPSLSVPLLHLPTKQDLALLGAAEKAAERGQITGAELGDIYRGVNFPPDKLANPMASTETGLRLRALLFQAALAEKTPSNRAAYAVKFIQTTPANLMNGLGSVAAIMLGSIKPEPNLSENAAIIAQIYMLAEQHDAALAWSKLARTNLVDADDLYRLWPQFTLAGLESDNDYDADFDKWLTATLKAADAQTDSHNSYDMAATALLLFDAAGLRVADSAWSKIMQAPHNEKHVALSPVLLDRLQAAGNGNRRAEAILLSVALASDGNLSLPEAVTITRALRLVGLKTEASNFARQSLAALAKPN